MKAVLEEGLATVSPGHFTANCARVRFVSKIVLVVELNTMLGVVVAFNTCVLQDTSAVKPCWIIVY
jgi:hypothetical protein